MDIEELLARESIRNTMSRYTQAGDRLKVAEFVAVFTEDGVLESQEVSAADAFQYRGRQAIGEWLQRWLEQNSEPNGGATQATFARHHLATCDIQFTGPDTAKACTYWTAYTNIGPDHCGYYLDNFRKVGEQWLIEHRRVRLDWRSPNSLFSSAISNTRAP